MSEVVKAVPPPPPTLAATAEEAGRNQDKASVELRALQHTPLWEMELWSTTVDVERLIHCEVCWSVAWVYPGLIWYKLDTYYTICSKCPLHSMQCGWVHRRWCSQVPAIGRRETYHLSGMHTWNGFFQTQYHSVCWIRTQFIYRS